MEKSEQTKKKNPLKHISAHDLDRDKNETYIPNDESVAEVIDPVGNLKFIHPNHETVKSEKVP